MEKVVSLYTYVANELDKFHRSGKPAWAMSDRQKRANRFAQQVAKQQQAPDQRYLKVFKEMKYKSKVVEIQAIQYILPESESINMMRAIWGEEFDRLHNVTMDGSLMVETRNGMIRVKLGDFVIKGDGEFYPCPADVFRAKYEEI